MKPKNNGIIRTFDIIVHIPFFFIFEQKKRPQKGVALRYKIEPDLFKYDELGSTV